MKQYKGYYIDEVVFNSTEEIDSFLKAQAIQAYKVACEYFAETHTIEAALFCDEKAQYLVNNFGMDWDEIAALEDEAMAA